MCFLQFVDLHHNLPIVPDFSVMGNLSSKIIASTLNPVQKNNKSVWSDKNNFKKKAYLERIIRMDSYLNIIYEYLNNNYEPNDISVCLTSDHGHSYLSDDKHPLSNARTKAIWLFKSGGNNKGGKVTEYTEGVDIFNTILSDCEIDIKHKVNGNLPIAFGGNNMRDFSFSQSIYPGQTYKAVINSAHGRYTYETKTPVGENGIANHENSIVEILQNDNTKKSFTKEHVKKIVYSRVGV